VTSGPILIVRVPKSCIFTFLCWNPRKSTDIVAEGCGPNLTRFYSPKDQEIGKG